MQDVDIILGQHDLGKLARYFGEIGFQKTNKQTNKKSSLRCFSSELRRYAVTRYAVTGITNNPNQAQYFHT